jgi:predicted nucleic acid-binding protein
MLVIKECGYECGIKRVKKYMKDEHTSDFYTTSFCFAEALGVLKRKNGAKKINQDTYLEAGYILTGFMADDGPIELVDGNISHSAVFAEVEEIARRYRLDIVDAYQIITIKKDYFFKNSLHSQPIFITADKMLSKAARKEGLRVWNCLKEDEPHLNSTKSSA